VEGEACLRVARSERNASTSTPLRTDQEKFRFKVLPVTLTFLEVTNLRIALDYATPTAALGPFSIDGIQRRVERRERYDAQIWNIVVNWPVGEISFEVSGFEQRGDGEPTVTDNQFLSSGQRGRGA
jgi:hypothetical protein